MLLEGTAQAILAASLLRLRSPPAQGIGSEEDVSPGSPAKTYEPIAFLMWIRDANPFQPMPAAKSRGLLRSALYHAGQTYPERLKLRQPLAQLREYFRIELSPKVTQPEHQCRPLGPELCKVFLPALRRGINKVRCNAADTYRNRHLGSPPCFLRRVGHNHPPPASIPSTMR